MAKTLPSPQEFSEATKIQNTPWMYGVVVLVFGIIIGGLIFISKFNSADYQRDVQNWKEKLGIIAESRRTEISNFITDNFAELRNLADNPSLRLYLTELQMLGNSDNDASGGEPSQKTYIRNLLLFTAQRSGFIEKGKLDLIPANIPSQSKSGLVVLTNNDSLVVGTPIEESSMSSLLQHVKSQEKGAEQLIDLQKDKSGSAYIGFSVPVFSIQGERNAESQIGKIVGIKTIDGNLFELLKQPASTEQTLEVLLMRVSGGEEKNIEYISPLKDGSPLLAKNIKVGDENNAESFMLGSDNHFSAGLKDYRGRKVIAVARDIAGTNWKMIVKIDTEEAFAESGAYRAGLITSFTLVIAVIVLIIVAMWWYSYSRHALMASKYFKKVATKSQAQENLLRLVSDNQPEAIYIVDKNQTYRFANQKLAVNVGMSVESIIGKTVSDVRGAARAEEIAAQCEKAVSSWQPLYDIHQDKHNGKEITIRCGYIPLEEIPISTLPEKTSGVLVVEQDVSEVYQERERRINTQKHLIETLVSLVDKRDPFSANHSFLVSHIAGQIASDMGLDKITVETTKTAANLMNIGKIVVPSALLSKSGQLNDEEKDVIRKSMDMSAELMEKISFDGPVSGTLKQWQERWDGSGPLKLKGEDILISARIISAANSFIGMISPRSWRDAMSIESANKFLLDNCGTYFDQKVVVALIHYVDNQSGRKWLKEVLNNKTAA